MVKVAGRIKRPGSPLWGHASGHSAYAAAQGGLAYYRILDLAHLADQSFWEALDVYTGPVIASHQNRRALVPGERQFSDAQLRAVIARDGVIGASMDTWMLYADGGLDWAKAGVTDRRAVFERGPISSIWPPSALGPTRGSPATMPGAPRNLWARSTPPPTCLGWS